MWLEPEILDYLVFYRLRSRPRFVIEGGHRRFAGRFGWLVQRVGTKRLGDDARKRLCIFPNHGQFWVQRMTEKLLNLSEEKSPASAIREGRAVTPEQLVYKTKDLLLASCGSFHAQRMPRADNRHWRAPTGALDLC